MTRSTELVLRISLFFLILFATPLCAQQGGFTNEKDFEKWYKASVPEAMNSPLEVRPKAMEHATNMAREGSENAGKAYYIVALTYVAVGDYDKSRENLKLALELTDKEDFPENYAFFLMSIGIDYLDEQKYGDALQYFSRALAVAAEYDLDECFQNKITPHVAYLYYAVDDYDRALSLLEPISTINECLPLYNASIHNDLALIFHAKGDFEAAQVQFEKFFSIAPVANVISRAYTKAQYVITLAELGQLQKAESLLEEIYETNKKYGNEHLAGSIEWSKANLYFAKEDYQNAVVKALIGLDDGSASTKLANEHIRLPLIIDALSKLGRTEEANEYIQRLLKNTPKYFSRNISGAISLGEVRLGLAEREGEIALMRKQAVIDKLRLERLSLLALFLLVSIMILVSMLRKKLEEKRLNAALMSLSEDNYLRAKSAETKLLKKQTYFQEAHHRITNNVQLILNLLEMQRRQINSEAMHTMSDALLEAINRVQAMAVIHHYTSAEVETSNYTLNQMFQSLSEQLFGTGDDLIKVNIDCVDSKLNPKTSKSLVLIVNELLCNVQKHAFDHGGGVVNITLSKDVECNYRMIVSDNGKGLPYTADIDRNASLGLKLVKSLVEQIDGSLNVVANSIGTIWEIEFNSTPLKS